MTDVFEEARHKSTVANKVWREVLRQNELPEFDRYRCDFDVYELGRMPDGDLLEANSRKDAEEFVSVKGEKYRSWADLLRAHGLTNRMPPYGFENQTLLDLAEDIKAEAQDRAYRLDRESDGTLADLYKVKIVALELKIIGWRRQIDQLKKKHAESPSIQQSKLEQPLKEADELSERLNELTRSNVARVEWEKSDRVTPPPEVGQLGHIETLTNVWGVKDTDFPLRLGYLDGIPLQMDHETGHCDVHGSVEGLGLVIESLTTAVTALTEWSMEQSVRFRKTNDELRDLIDQRTATASLTSRNIWLYNQASDSNDSYEKIRLQMNAIASERGWVKLETAEGVRQGVLKHCNDAGIPPMKRR